MTHADHDRRHVLQLLLTLPMAGLLDRPGAVHAQTGATTQVRVDTKGLTPKIKFESPLAATSRSSTGSTSFA